MPYIRRFEQFASYAGQVGDGAVTSPPADLRPRARRLHVRNTLIEDHVDRLGCTPEQIPTRFSALASSVTTFFRGTALLFYRDRAGADGQLPVVHCVGEAHPEAFGLVPGADGRPVFTVRGLSEAHPAPFTYDVSRGATALWLAAGAAGGSPKKTQRVVEDWIRGYASGVETASAGREAADLGVDPDDVPDVLEKAVGKADRSRRTYIGKRLDDKTGTLRSTGSTDPAPDHREMLTAALEGYLPQVRRPELPEDFFTVLDTALRDETPGVPTARPRYWVLVKGWGPGVHDAVILELCPAPAPALRGLVPPSAERWADASRPVSDRIAATRHVLASDGDRLYGATHVDGFPYTVRERGPARVNIRLGTLDLPSLRQFAALTGRTLAELHVRSLREDPERVTRLVRASGTEAFVHDMVEEAQETAARAQLDHEYFREDLERGAFRL